MCEHGQHGSERAKACCEEYEEGKLFLWVYRHLVESWRKDERADQHKVRNGVHKHFKRGLMLLYVQGSSSLSAVSVHPG